jgi:hypothetical protein
MDSFIKTIGVNLKYAIVSCEKKNRKINLYFNIPPVLPQQFNEILRNIIPFNLLVKTNE